MAYNFPDAPTFGQIFAPAGGPQWQWDGNAWKSGVSTASGNDASNALVIATGGTTARTLSEWMSDLNTLDGSGGVGNDSTDNAAAITAARAFGPVYVPEGIYKTTQADTQVLGPFWGAGQIRDSGNNLRAPWFVARGAPPSSYGNPNSVVTAFNGDLSTVLLPIEHRLTGATTLTQPATGYAQVMETAAISARGFNSSGHNQSTSANSGRTGASLINLHVAQAGQGDYGAITAGGVVASAKAGATSFLANPAAFILNGGLTAGIAGAYLNILELNAGDNGFDCAAIGAVHNFTRTIGTAALGAVWMGTRHQSVGSVAADVAYSSAGLWKRVLDTTHVTLDAAAAAIAMKADQRVYMNAVASGAVGWSQAPGAVYFDYNSVAAGLDFVLANDVPSLRLTAVATPVNFLTVQAQAVGVGPVIAPAGSDTNVSIVYTTKGTDQHYFRTNGSSGPLQLVIGAAVGVNYLFVQGGPTLNGPILRSDGTDTDISGRMRGKGTGGWIFQDGASVAKFQYNTTGIGFFAATPVAKQTVSGVRTSADTGLASLLTALSNFGLATDSTTVNDTGLVTGGKITIASSAPGSPATGDVWIDTT